MPRYEEPELLAWFTGICYFVLIPVGVSCLVFTGENDYVLPFLPILFNALCYGAAFTYGNFPTAVLTAFVISFAELYICKVYYEEGVRRNEQIRADFATRVGLTPNDPAVDEAYKLLSVAGRNSCFSPHVFNERMKVARSKEKEYDERYLYARELDRR
jgi:hypothetical protein